MELRLAASKAKLENDPLGGVLEAFGASLGAMGEILDHAEATRQPLDAKARADMTRQLVQACRADFLRQAAMQSRRLAMLSGVGAAVLLLTSELEEIQRVCDRAIVIYGGRVVEELPASEADEPTLLRAAHGLPAGDAA